jgi:hypothetical protein
MPRESIATIVFEIANAIEHHVDAKHRHVILSPHELIDPCLTNLGWTWLPRFCFPTDDESEREQNTSNNTWPVAAIMLNRR